MNLGKPIGIRLEPKIEKNLRNEAARREIHVTELIREIISNDQRYIQDFSLIKNEIHALRH